MGVRSVRLWLEAHVWVVATAGVAAIVFGVTFIAVSAATDSGPAIPERVVAAPQAEPEPSPQPPVESSPGEAKLPTPASESPAPGEQALADPIKPEAAPEAAPEEEPAPPDPAPEPAPEPEPDVEVQEAVEEPPPPPRPLPEFDEDELIYGGNGEAGAILGGQGIVSSSGFAAQTPWEFILPSAQIRAAIVRVGLTHTNALGAPDNPSVIGWWDSGPEPGQPGNVLLDGHRDFTDTDGNVGTGVCWLLPNTVVGDFVIIRDNEARTNYLYSVIETASVPWNDPSGLAYLQPTRESILTLVTCEGSFDEGTHNYSNRRIVVAELTDTIPFPSEE